ncbi:MAG TPA: hypothetical protein ENK82_09590, partial [Campylobacterales bacterium]|nr:hypothetical protein [Campylobacterales bacterium]
EDVHSSGVAYDDGIDINVPLGFSFPFNGTTYTEVDIDSNGYLVFGTDPKSVYTNQTLAQSDKPQSIYPYWDDLNVANGGTIRYGTLGTGDNIHFVVSWENVPQYPSYGTFSLQVILYLDGSIRFRYDATSSVDGASGTVGVQENTTNYDQHSFNNSSTFDATKDILYTSILTQLTAVTPSCTTPSSQINMTTYNTTAYNSYPNDSTQYATLIQNYATDANLFGTGTVAQINGSGNPYGSNENYLSIFEGYIYLPTTGVYAFGVDGDDAIEVYIDDTLITGWYGGHGRANQAREIVNVFAYAGWHKLTYHHQERGGADNYYLYWQPPNGSLEIVPATQLFHCSAEAKMSIVKSSCTILDPVNGAVNPKRIPGATIRFAMEVSNTGAASATNVLLSDSLSSEFDTTSINNIQVQAGACDCLGVTSASNNGANGTADGVHPIVLDFGTVLGGSVATPTKECGYFEVELI